MEGDQLWSCCHPQQDGGGGWHQGRRSAHACWPTGAYKSRKGRVPCCANVVYKSTLEAVHTYK
eukprot:1157389-Pelagomonas_calceolata.AAC.5